jgi:hypothetical protein
VNPRSKWTSSNYEKSKWLNAANYKSPTDGGSLLDILKRQSTKEGAKPGDLEYSPGKVSAAIAAATYALSVLSIPQPTDIYMPGYNMGYLDLRDQRPGFTYIDPTYRTRKSV